MSPWTRLGVIPVVLCNTVALSCATAGPGQPLHTKPPSTQSEPGIGTAEGRTAGELRQRLEHLTAKRNAIKASTSEDVTTCENICELATAICEVAERLHEIAERHVGEESFQQLYREAQQECKVSVESCTNCAADFQRGQIGPPPP